ncbi:unnamed protein product [Malus baccata var. baccata]
MCCVCFLTGSMVRRCNDDKGDEPILKQAQTCPIPRFKIVDTLGKEKTEVRVDKNRLDRWKATGVIGLSDYNLKDIPDEVWASGTSARVIELGNNSIRDVSCVLPDQDLPDKGLPDRAQEESRSTTDTLNRRHSPRGVVCSSARRFLRRTVSAKIGCLNSLQVDVSSNLLSELPETMGSLKNLKSLYLSNNGLKFTTLDLHNTEITVDVLRQFEGWEGFDERRRLKHQKQLDFRVVNSGAFDEGVDKS